MTLRITCLFMLGLAFTLSLFCCTFSASVSYVSRENKNSTLSLYVDEEGNIVARPPIVAEGGHTAQEDGKTISQPEPAGTHEGKAAGVDKKVDDDVEVLENDGSSPSKTAVIAGVSIAVVGMMLISLCLCRCMMKKRGSSVDGGVRTVSERSSLGFLTEYRSGGEDTIAEVGFGGWLRRSLGREKRYAAESLEMDFVKADAGSKVPGSQVAEAQEGGNKKKMERKAHKEAQANQSTPVADLTEYLHDVELGDRVAENNTVTVGEGVVRGSSLVEDLQDSGWSRVEEDIAGFDYVIGLGHREDIEGVGEFMQRRVDFGRDREAQEAQRQVENGKISRRAPVETARTIESNRPKRLALDEDDLNGTDPPLIDPYRFKRFAQPEKV